MNPASYLDTAGLAPGKETPPPLFALPTVKEADARRDAGIARSQAGAERSSPGFGKQAAKCIRDYLAKNGPTPGEDLVTACNNAGIVPPKGNRAFGGVFQSLSRRGVIEVVGFCKRRHGNNTSGGNVWGLVESAEAGKQSE